MQERFRNPAIAHETYQIAMDGTQKLPQRLLEPATVALERGRPLDAFAFAVAAWMRYALGRREDGEGYVLRDPRENEIASLLEEVVRTDGYAIMAALSGLPGLFPMKLAANAEWTNAVQADLSLMLGQGMRAAIDKEAGNMR